MSERDAFKDRGRASEEEYFRKKELELIEKMRQRAEHQPIAEAVGITDDEILGDLQALGYTRETVTLLHVVPLIQVAWIDGEVAGSERERIYELARVRGVELGSVAYQQLTDWLTHRPSREFFEKTWHIIQGILKASSPRERETMRRDLVAWCTDIAAAAGGFLGFGSKISQEEQALLERVATQLAQDHEAAAAQVMSELQP